jgi:hypothetical protein
MKGPWVRPLQNHWAGGSKNHMAKGLCLVLHRNTTDFDEIAHTNSGPMHAVIALFEHIVRIQCCTLVAMPWIRFDHAFQ